MVSLAEIESNLTSEEIILWKKQNYINELKQLKFTLNILILSLAVSIFSILFYFLNSKFSLDVFLGVFILLTILLISGFPLYLFLNIYNEYKRITQRLELKLSNLRSYEEFFILTNKRWIQKSFHLAKIDEIRNEKNQIIKKKDIAFVNLDSIKVIYISPQKEGKVYHINFFKLWDKNLEESIFHVFLEENDYKKMIEILRKIVEIIKEEHDVFKYGDCAFYCKK
ncbi:MAG: hypothetical protein ACFE92_15820 [Promethearchaeota archaeon]